MTHVGGGGGGGGGGGWLFHDFNFLRPLLGTLLECEGGHNPFYYLFLPLGPITTFHGLYERVQSKPS